MRYTQFSVQELTLHNFFNVIKFCGRQKQRKHVQGNDIQDALSPSTAIFLFIFDETIKYQSKSLCLILGVDGWFIFCLHKTVVYRHFSYFHYGFQTGRQWSRDYFYYYGSNERFIY